MESESLNEILSNEPEAETPAQLSETGEATNPIVDPPSGVLRDERGRFAPKETGVEAAPAATATSEAPPAPPSGQLPQEEYSALRAVRDENKELKRQIAAIQRQMTQPAPQPAPTPVDFWDDPQSFMDSRMNQLGQTLLQQWEQRETVRRLDASEKTARAKYTDYDEAFEAFEQAVQTNPQLAAQLAQADDPGEFAYRKGKTAIEIQRVGSIDELKAQIRAELEAEARAAIGGQPRPVLPSTTAGDGSVGARSGPEWAGPKPLGQILK